jgi:hypothetical protein
MRPSWEIAPYFAFIDVHFVLRHMEVGEVNPGYFPTFHR